MLYLLQSLYISNISILRIFKSIVIRGSIAFFVAFMIMLLFGNKFIEFLRKKKMGDKIREEGPSTHFSKVGTPTMGGLLIIISIVISTLVAGNFTNKYTIFLLVITILFTSIGAYDDYLKLTKSKKGLSSKKKLLGQLIMTTLTFAFILIFKLSANTKVDLAIINPFIKNSYIYLGYVLFFIFMILVIVGSSNAVNLTDGLDGLVSGPIMIVSILFLMVSYFAGHIELAQYLNIYYIEGAGEIAVYLSSVIGAMIGFLWFNFYPAQVFMGDTGSLTLGGILGIISIFVKQELLLTISGIVFIAEAVSCNITGNIF